jgi:hypothetical protein
MRSHDRGRSVALVAALVATCGAGVSCGGSDQPASGKHDVWFMGAVIDGATGMTVPGYTISLVYGPNTVTGKVDGNGRYVLGPFPAWNDYGILIDSDGYRAFSSYNTGISPPVAPSASNQSFGDVYRANTSQTFNYDAYLFPKAVTAPDVTVSIFETGLNPVPAAGNIRLQPTSGPTIQGQATEVANQLWSNDNDLFAATISSPFTAGTFKALGSMLVYGVSYQVTVYGVPDHQPGTSAFQAGINSMAMVTLAPQTAPMFQLLSRMPTPCTVSAATDATSTAQQTFTFNARIEDATASPGGGAEALDNSFSVYDSSFVGLHPNLSPTVQEHGTSFVIADNTLTISWSPLAGLASQPAGNTVNEVIYGMLGSIFLQPVGHAELRASLSSLLSTATSNVTSIYCFAN